MDFMKNVPEVPGSLADMINVHPHQVVSMAMSQVPNVQMTLFSFAEGEGVSSEIYPGDMWYYVVEGTMIFRRNKVNYEMKAGDCVAVPAGAAHSLRSKGDFKVLQISLQNAEER